MTVAALTDNTIDLFGKTVDDLQTGVSFGNGTVTGTLKYVDDYTGFSSKVEEQSGNYIVLKAEVPEVSDVTITVKITNPVTLDSDGIFVGKIADKSSQTITVVASKTGLPSVTRTFTLSGLTVEAA